MMADTAFDALFSLRQEAHPNCVVCGPKQDQQVKARAAKRYE